MNSKHYKGKGRVEAENIKRPEWDNRNKFLEKKCPKCGKKFLTKLQNGFLNCKECNQ